MNDKKDVILAKARDRIETLREEAQIMVDGYWAYYLKENKAKRNFDEKSRLFPRVGKTKNAFSIEWYHIKKWFKNHKDQWKKVTRYIARGRSHRMKLDAYAQPWELDVLNAFEDRAEMIRREVKILTDLIEGCDRLGRLAEKRKEAA